jgi:hypothetical protein
MKKILIVFVLMLFSSAYAANWVEVSHKYYLDLSSYQKHYSNSGTYVTIWSKVLNDGNMKPINNKKVWYYNAKEYYDCTNRKTGASFIVSYGLDGNSLGSYDFGKPLYSEVVPETVSETLWNYVCGK